MITRTFVVAGTSAALVLTGAAAQRWQKQAARVFDPYQPELHYMRGPGPKWRQKYGAR
jgi:hypothetical protein